MQRRTRLLPVLLIAAAGAAGTSGVRAAELGDIRVSSHIGQQLVADIELTLLEDSQTPVQVRLADPEVYSGAGIALPPALSTLTLSVMRRDGRQFLHATTLRPVDADHVHLYVELVDHGQRAVRLATLWLTPDPNPAPVRVPAPAAVAAPAPVVVPAPAAAPVPAPAPVRARGQAELAPTVRTAARPRALEAPPPSAAATPMPAAISPAHPPLSLPLPSRRAAPAACTPADGDVQACVALGARNAELRNRIGQLEERVKTLQTRLGVVPGRDAAKPESAKPDTPKAEATEPNTHAAPHVAASTPAVEPKPATDAKPADAKQSEAKHAEAKPPEAKTEAKPPEAKPPEAKPPEIKPPEIKLAPPGPKPISSIKPLVAHKPKTPPPDDDLPWGALGAGVAALAAVGAAVALLRVRAKRLRSVDIPAEPGLLARLRGRFGKRADPAPARLEPVEGGVAEPSLE